MSVALVKRRSRAADHLAFCKAAAVNAKEGVGVFIEPNHWGKRSREMVKVARDILQRWRELLVVGWLIGLEFPLFLLSSRRSDSIPADGRQSVD